MSRKPRQRISNRRNQQRKRAAPDNPILVLANKPYNTLCQFSGEPGDKTLADFIDIKDVYPAGRLDKDSEGLLLLTNDGSFQHKISHPKFKMPKTYWVQVEGEVNDDALKQLQMGVELNDGITRPAEAKRLDSKEVETSLWARIPPIRSRQSIPTEWIELTIREGKNRQVRRMTAAVGHPTLRLIRVAIGPWKIAGMQPGEFTTIKL